MIDGHGTSAVLNAHHLKSLSIPLPGIRALSLRENLYAQLVYLGHTTGVEIFDWRESTYQLHIKTSFVIRDKYIVSGPDCTMLSAHIID